MATSVLLLRKWIRPAYKTESSFLALADPLFDVLVTINKGIQYQQNMTGRRIAIVILRGRSNHLVDLSPNFQVCAEILQSLQPGQVVEIGN